MHLSQWFRHVFVTPSILTAVKKWWDLSVLFVSVKQEACTV